jgi:hypothetical protein
MMIAPVARLFSAMSFYFAYRLAVQATPRHNSDRKKENIMKVIKSAAELAKLEAGQKVIIESVTNSTGQHYRQVCYFASYNKKYAAFDKAKKWALQDLGEVFINNIEGPSINWSLSTGMSLGHPRGQVCIYIVD